MVKISANRMDLETKRLDRAQMRNYTEALVAVTASATTTLDISAGNVFDLTHGADITTLTISNIPTTGLCTITIFRTKDASGTSRTIAWPSSFKWEAATAPTLTQTASAIDVIVATTKNGGTSWFALVAGQALAAVPTASLWAWGGNAYGQLGLGDTTARSSPVQVGALKTWAMIAPISNCMLATKTDGTLWSWGRNNRGQLGQGDTSNRSSPTQVGALTNWAFVEGTAGGNYPAVLAVKTDGTLWAWGSNSFGVLGLGDTAHRSSPVQVGALTNWARVSVGAYYTAAIKTDGTLWTWGYGGSGATGHGNTTNYSSPVQVGALTNWARASMGNAFGLAVKTDGTLWAWGQNGSGPLGDGTVTTRSSPVQIGALTNWLDVSGFSNSSFALKTDGTLWAWGSNSSGQLGKGNTTNYSSPVQVGALTTWTSMSRMSVPAALKSGQLWTWGYGGAGRTGHGNTTSYSSPVQVGALTTWSSAQSGGNFMAGIILQ